MLLATRLVRVARAGWGQAVTPTAPPSSRPASTVGRLVGRRLPWFRLGVAAGGAGALLAMWSVRRYRDSLVLDLQAGQHIDRSVAHIASVKSQVVPTVKIVTSTETNGRLVEAEQYSEFVQQSVAVLLAAQREMEVEASRLLDSQLALCFNEIQPRAENFADWYFAYSTSFKLLSEASLSLARHAAKLLEKTPINEAVAADMDRYLTTRYERIVLRPELSDPAVEAAYLSCVRDLHHRYLAVVTRLEQNMAGLLAAHTNHLNPPQATDLRLNLDWASQLHKIKSVPVNFEKSPELTLALSSGGAIIGKTLASKGASLATTKALAGKLSAPFVSKAVAAGGGAVAGSVAGPMGTVMGATIGIGIDYTVNAGIELMKREEFVRDVEMVVAATRADYQRVLERELHRAARVWVEDAIQLLPQSAAALHQTQQEGSWLKTVNVNVGHLIWRGTSLLLKLSPF